MPPLTWCRRRFQGSEKPGPSTGPVAALGLGLPDRLKPLTGSISPARTYGQAKAASGVKPGTDHGTAVSQDLRTASDGRLRAGQGQPAAGKIRQRGGSLRPAGFQSVGDCPYSRYLGRQCKVRLLRGRKQLKGILKHACRFEEDKCDVLTCEPVAKGCRHQTAVAFRQKLTIWMANLNCGSIRFPGRSAGRSGPWPDRRRCENRCRPPGRADR